jgi:fructokinase
MIIITIGEVLWDVFDDRRLIGGAPFNFSAHAVRLGHDVTFISAVGDDELADETLNRIGELNLSTKFIPKTSKAATGTVRVFVDDGGQPSYAIHRPAAYDFPSITDESLRRLALTKPDWIYFGTLAQLAGDVRAVTRRIIAACPNARRFYDVNLRKNSFTKELILELLAETSVLKINDDEVAQVTKMIDGREMEIADFCRVYSGRYNLQGICVTRGAKGCYVHLGGNTADISGRPVKVADTVGAGDAFAAAFLHGFRSGWEIHRIGDFANRLGALVASRAGAIPEWTMEELG